MLGSSLGLVFSKSWWDSDAEASLPFEREKPEFEKHTKSKSKGHTSSGDNNDDGETIDKGKAPMFKPHKFESSGLKSQCFKCKGYGHLANQCPNKRTTMIQEVVVYDGEGDDKRNVDDEPLHDVEEVMEVNPDVGNVLLLKRHTLEPIEEEQELGGPCNDNDYSNIGHHQEVSSSIPSYSLNVCKVELEYAFGDPTCPIWESLPKREPEIPFVDDGCQASLGKHVDSSKFDSLVPYFEIGVSKARLWFERYSLLYGVLFGIHGRLDCGYLNWETTKLDNVADSLGAVAESVITPTPSSPISEWGVGKAPIAPYNVTAEARSSELAVCLVLSFALPFLILALLAETLIEIQEQVINHDEEDSDWEEVDAGDADVEQDLFQATAKSSSKPSYEHLAAMAKVFEFGYGWSLLEFGCGWDLVVVVVVVVESGKERREMELRKRGRRKGSGVVVEAVATDLGGGFDCSLMWVVGHDVGLGGVGSGGRFRCGSGGGFGWSLGRGQVWVVIDLGYGSEGVGIGHGSGVVVIGFRGGVHQVVWSVVMMVDQGVSVVVVDQIDVDDDDLLSSADPLNEINLANYLVDFLVKFYQSDRALFDQLAQSLTQSQRHAIQMILNH
ncbi:Polyprotein P3 [Bienertia sinuspersici]